MTINRRKDQTSSSPAEGLNVLAMTGGETGSKMLTVGDLTVQPGAGTSYHIHPNTEESIFLVEGELEFRLGDHKFRIAAGDCVLAPRGTGHGPANAGERPARAIFMYPTAAPQMEEIEEPEFTDAEPDGGVSFRARMTPYEFKPGVSRFDMVGDFLGAESTYFSELTFQPGGASPNHYHPAHEESMFCLSGQLSAVYGADDDVPLATGDILTCEPTIRHSIHNSSGETAKLLAIHPVLNPPPRVDLD